ncbi:MAG: hypothetical protein GX146_08830 [Myxococcales bacterium]|jgi:hypothetical protein|nr:hypothetical protein [Myxococcales bacterium]
MKAIVLKIGVAILALSALGCGKKQQDAQPTDIVHESTSEPTLAVANITNTVPWRSGELGVYRVEMSSRLADSSNHLLLDLSVEAHLHVAVQRVQGSRTTLSLALVGPLVRLEGDDPSRTSAQAASLQDELTQPFVGTFHRGAMEEMGFSSGASAFAVGVRRTLLSGLQVPVLSPDARSIEAREFDANGEVVVRYTKIDEGSWRLEKQSYVRGLYENDGADAMQQGPRPVLKSAKGNLLMADGRLVRAERSDVVHVDIMDAGGMRSHTALSVALDTTAPPPDASLLSLDASAMTVLAADKPWHTPLDIGAMDAARMEGLTFDAVLKALVAKAKDPRRRGLWSKKNDETASEVQAKDAAEWTEDWSRYFSALPAFFRQQPQTLKRAEKEIRRGSPATTSLIGGLSSSGIAAAQQLLLKLARDTKLDAALRESALRNVAQCRQPTVETAEALRALYADAFSKRYAVFGTGIISRKLRESGDEAAALAGVNWLLSLLQTESVAAERRDILRGLANAGHPAVLAPMERLLASDVMLDRAGALEALRLVRDPVVDERIAHHLRASVEPEGAVREAAVQAASTRRSADPLRQALIAAAKTDPEKRVRGLAFKLLRQWSAHDPALVPIIASMAEFHEPS